MKIHFKIKLDQLSYVAGITAVILASSCKEKVAEIETIRPVFYQKIARASEMNQFTVPGVVQFDTESKMSFKVSGVITKVNISAGQKVKKGTILAALDATDYKVNFTQANATSDAMIANVQNAQTQLINAKSNFLRTEQMYVNNHTSLSEYEKAKAQYENAKGGLNAAQSQAEASNAKVVAAQNQLNYTQLLAPVDGTISQIFIEENEMIGAGIPAMVLASDNAFEVNSVVPERWITQLTVGQEVEIRVASLNQTFKGSIKEMATNSQANTGYPLKITFTQNTDAIKSGMSVQVHIPSIKNNEFLRTILIDTDAVSKDEDGFFVFTLEKKEDQTYTARRRGVEVGNLTKEGYEIMNGLKHDEMIATAGIRFLYDGKIVTLQEQNLR